ncbi:MAG: hypothetical protein GY866_14545 [Proteobacteria bacterium]|nr:hypothetical protein [Pseudomonadota bacterium]
MRLLYIVKREPGETFRKIVDEQKKEHDVEIVDLRDDVDYDSILEKIEGCDRVVSW